MKPSIPSHTFLPSWKLLNFYIALDTIYFYIFRMLPVNELAVISSEWKPTGSLPGYLPTEAATGSRPKKMYYIGSKSILLLESAAFFPLLFIIIIPSRCHIPLVLSWDHSARWETIGQKGFKKHCLLVSVHMIEVEHCHNFFFFLPASFTQIHTVQPRFSMAKGGRGAGGVQSSLADLL